MRPDRALTFKCAGEDLVAVLSETGEDTEIGVLLIVGGPQYRAGSHRQFVLLARRLAQAGIPAMRFDHRGMGDSSGSAQTFEETTPDIAAAISAFIAARPSIRRVVLWGLCDAASAALLYWRGTADPRVGGMVLLNPWVRSDETLARTHIRHYYGARLLQRGFWKKMASGRLDIVGTLREFGRALMASRRTDRSECNDTPPFQARMAEALQAFGGPVLLILSGNDLTAREFVDYCRSAPRHGKLTAREGVDQVAVPDADHTFSSSAWRLSVEEGTLAWLRRHFPVRAQ